MASQKTALIVLNRNLPGPTDALCERFLHHEAPGMLDVYVIEAGSDEDKLSRFASWHVNTPDVIQQGLRSSRGFNYGIKQLFDCGQLEEYEYLFLVTNDSVFDEGPILPALIEEMERHPKLGVLSPCSRRWGERDLLVHEPTRYFWYVHNTAYLMRRRFIEALMNVNDEQRFLYDGDNFRGYGAESELIAKGYANDWATAITNRVYVEENESHLLEHSAFIRTESYEQNLALYVDEGRRWMKAKYGFTSRWQMQMYAQFWYDKFFEYHPEYTQYKI
jgi:hypothetical protein